MEENALSAETILSGILNVGWQIVLAVLIFSVGWMASKWAYSTVNAVAQKRAKDTMLARFLASIAQWAVVAIAGIAALGKVGVETTSLVALLASAGVAIGLALQGNLSNFASGVMLLIFRPLEIGDVVEAGGHTGRVEDIGIFASTFSTPDNHVIVLPNSAITGGSLTNFTKRGTRRGKVEVGVAYGSDIAQIKEILLGAARSSELVREEPAPAVAFTNMGASSLDFAVLCWCANADYLAMLDDVRTRMYDALNAAGVDIPYNQIVVHQAAADGDAEA